MVLTARGRAVRALPAVVLAGAAAACGGDASGGPAADPAAAARAQRPLDRRVVALAPVFRRAQTTVDRSGFDPDARTVAELRSRIDARFDQVRRLPATTMRLWAVPARGWVCLFYLPSDGHSVKPGAGCARTSDYLEARGALTIANDDSVDIAGLVPDGVRSVVVAGRGGRRAVLPVNDGAYAGRVRWPTRRVFFTGPAGRRSAPALSAP